MSSLLDARGVTFSYGERAVLRDVGVALAAGEIVALLGPNGSGKSTLLRVLLGQLLASGAAICWQDRLLAQWKGRELARRVAYLPQAPAWEGEDVVSEVLMTGRAPYWAAFGIESAADLRAVEEVARGLGLAELMGRRMDELSGGQRQRVFVGRCLVQQPVAMLLDEPNTFLDLRHQVELAELLRKLARERVIGVLMASHDLNLAGALADRIVLLHEGRVAAAGSVSEVFRPEVLSPVYGVPIVRIDDVGGRPVVLPSVGHERT
jgi:iron complex transport system ATP-binding protein